MEEIKNSCWFCLKEINPKEKDIEYSEDVESYFHLFCLIKDYTESEILDYDTILIANEMNDKGYEIGEEE